MTPAAYLWLAQPVAGGRTHAVRRVRGKLLRTLCGAKTVRCAWGGNEDEVTCERCAVALVRDTTIGGDDAVRMFAAWPEWDELLLPPARKARR